MIIVWVFVFIKRSNCKFLKSASSTVPHHGKNYACNALWERNEAPQKLDFLFEITSFLLWGLPQKTYPAIKVSIGCLARVIVSTAARTRNKCRVRPPMKPARACSQTMTDERKCSVGTMVDLSLLAFLISCSSTHMTNSILVITETLSVSASFLIRPQSSLQSFILCLSVYKAFVWVSWKRLQPSSFRSCRETSTKNSVQG